MRLPEELIEIMLIKDKEVKDNLLTQIFWAGYFVKSGRARADIYMQVMATINEPLDFEVI